MYLSNCPTCGLLVRAGNQSCRHCAEMAATKARRELAERNAAALEWALVGEKPVEFFSPVATGTEADHRISRQRPGKDD